LPDPSPEACADVVFVHRCEFRMGPCLASIGDK
jgi:hypothetical protein